MHGLVRCKHECRCSRACGKDVSFRDVKIKIPDRNWPGGVSDVMHRKRELRIFGIWEKAESWVPASEREIRDSELGEARRIWALRAPCVGWVESWRCKSSQHRKIVSLSPHVEKAFKLKKVNKSFVPEPISSFRIPIYVYEHFMNIMSISHIRIMGMLQNIVICEESGNLKINANLPECKCDIARYTDGWNRHKGIRNTWHSWKWFRSETLLPLS